MPTSSADVELLSGELAGCDDFEIGQPRTSALTWRAAVPAAARSAEGAAGLVIFIPGFGPDADTGYSQNLIRHLAAEHRMVALDVDYHCRRARPSNGASVQPDGQSELQLRGLGSLLGIPTQDCATFAQLASRFKQHAAKLAPVGGWAVVKGTLVPPDGAYQNFGILQAIDHLLALADLDRQLEAHGLRYDRRRTIGFGSSHGGYIAHLMHRMAPARLAAIVDNSSYTRALPSYLGQGMEMLASDPPLKLSLSVATRWQFTDPAKPAFFSRDRELIRDTAYLPMLRTAALHRQSAGAGPLQVVLFHSTQDRLASPQDKLRQARGLAANGVEVSLTLAGPEHLDGKRFKSLDHGLGASLKTLADETLPTIRPTGLAHRDLPPAAYDCLDGRYRFVFDTNTPRFLGGYDEERDSPADLRAAA